MNKTNTHPGSKRRWDFDSLAVNTIFSLVTLAIFGAGTGVGWCLGALGGKLLELLNVQEAVHYGGILGGALGFGYTIYVCFRRPKPAPPGPEISEEEASEKQRRHDGLVWEHQGWDHFIIGTGEAPNMACPVCSEVMEVELDIPGIPRYTAFLAGMASDHDLFLCKFRREGWHQQALELLKMAEETASGKLQQLLEAEARAILRDRKPTKKSWKGFGSRSYVVVG